MTDARKRLFLLAGFWLVIGNAACSNQQASIQGDPQSMQITNEDLFKDYAYNAKRPGAVRWTEEGAKYTALETAAGYEDAVLEKDRYGDDIRIYEEIVEYDPASGERSILISLDQLTPPGTDAALVVDDYRWSDDRTRVLIYTDAEYVWREKSRGDYWVRELDSGALWQLGGDHAGTSEMMHGKFAPDGQKFAWVFRNNIFVQDLSNREITALTSDGSDIVINGRFDWVYEEEFSIRDGFRWSPDSQRIAYWQLDTRAARDFFIINNTDTLYPQVTAIPYPKVGEENATARIGVVPVAGGDTVWADLPGDPANLYLPRMDWADNASQILIQQLNRKQDTNTVFYVDAETGLATTAFTEREETFIAELNDPQWLEDSKAFIWHSERDGWRHIYRVSRDGSTFTDLTPGDFDVTDLVSVDETGGWLYFMASPDDMARRYLYRTRLDGSGQMERVSPPGMAGTHHYQMAADATWAIHSYSSFLQPPVYSLVSIPDHATQLVLEDNADLVEKLAAQDIGELEFFDVAATDGTRLDGYMLRPPNFNPAGSYPVIHYVYGEPAGQTVVDAWQNNRNLWHVLMSQRGFLITSIDNRGTAAPRGHAWRRSIYGSPGEPETRDQADALEAICARWRFVDCERIGVWGHSGGGSLTLNLMFRHPDQFHVGISLAPVPDKRLYDSIYQERYSGLLPDYEASYVQASAITHAAGLKGKLLLIHGTGDDNVHYQGTERLINELVKHNRQFEFMAYPNRRHGLVEGEGTSLHLHTLKTRYFTEHLMAE